MKNRFVLVALFSLLQMVGVLSASGEEPTYLKCGLNEVLKDGSTQSLFINACSIVTQGAASVHFQPDGDDFAYENPTYDAKMLNGNLVLTLKPFQQSALQAQFEVSPDSPEIVRSGVYELNCSITTNPKYANGIDVCR